MPLTIVIDPPEVGDDPRVVALLTVPNTNVESPAVKQLITFKSGYGYVEAPNVVAPQVVEVMELSSVLALVVV